MPTARPRHWPAGARYPGAGAGVAIERKHIGLLWLGRQLRLQSRALPDRDGRWRWAIRLRACEWQRPGGLRLRDLSLADRPRRRCDDAAPDRAFARGVRLALRDKGRETR